MAAPDASALRVIQQISDAFGDAQPPRHPMTVLSAEAHDVALAFAGKHWRAITLDFLATGYRDAMNLMSTEHRRYYLPAYLVAVLTDLAKADVAVDSVFSYLTKPDTRYLRRYHDSGEEFARVVESISSARHKMSGEEYDAFVRGVLRRYYPPEDVDWLAERIVGIRKTISDSDTVKYVSRLLTGDDPTWRYRNRQGREQWFRELGGHSAHEHEEDFYSFIEPMTLSQRLAIRAFLEHMRDRHGEELFGESEAALELYWENVKREGTDS